MSGVRRIKLGSQGIEVSAIGLGCMGMSQGYGLPKPEEEIIKVIHQAVNSDVSHLDTSYVYGPYTNEILIDNKNSLLRRAMRVVKRSNGAQMRVKEDPVITRDDTLLRVLYLRRAVMTHNAYQERSCYKGRRHAFASRNLTTCVFNDT
ncbi:unnamed protein product [Lactuca saligna]|uniref:NADP-dependent oxidoreductase domain-containing protein n=1 Tax=Lactuca saligna TaxID=75948 RepID=A0AA35VC06_LACSI|nr:unnamed protein product [Lactuca saligna]